MLIESSTVTNCSAPPRTSRSVRPRQGRISASRPGCRCERFSFVDTWTVSAHCSIAAVVLAVSGRRDEVAASPGTRRCPRRACPGWCRPCRAVLAGRLEPEFVVDRVEERLGHPLPDPHRAVALTLLCRAPGRRPRPAGRFAPQQQEVDDLAKRRHGVGVLGEPHRPAHDHALAATTSSTNASIVARAARPRRRSAKSSSPRRWPPRRTRRSSVDELVVDRVPFDQDAVHRVEQGEVGRSRVRAGGDRRSWCPGPASRAGSADGN